MHFNKRHVSPAAHNRTKLFLFLLNQNKTFVNADGVKISFPFYTYASRVFWWQKIYTNQRGKQLFTPKQRDFFRERFRELALIKSNYWSMKTISETFKQWKPWSATIKHPENKLHQLQARLNSAANSTKLKRFFETIFLWKN